MKQKIKNTWTWLVGDSPEFTAELIAFNSIAIITLIILLVLLPINMLIGLMNVTLMIIVLIIAQFTFYYLSRFKKRYLLGVAIYTIVSYGVLILNFFFNAGSYGPTLSLFFLTFQLLIAFSPKRWHFLLFLAHFMVPLALMFVEYYRPELVPYTYVKDQDRFVDLLTSYLVILVGMYWITIYLRNNYLREKGVADQAHLEKIKLFSVISHDLKSPLAAAVSLGQLINEFQHDEADRKELQKELLNINKATLDMFTNLVAWSSTQMQGARARLTKVDLRSCINNVLQIQQRFLTGKQIRIHVELVAEPAVKADVDMMELVIRNIVQNAIKFSPVGGEIWITNRITRGRYVLMIRDKGVGINAARLKHLFTLSIDSSYGTGNEKGSGLGLHLCKEFMKLQGGQIWASSVEHMGSTFYISIPVYTDAG
ncbi:sensor histidine kinase [Filimonas effusa]|uniref:histidine kinase n=1 Tax=Filimonas effusa TaxID=2508721 RepID=A0A4Q1D4Y6_9BACT|nr:HAMP domain-containing sensor histidine kinase [Filimonas effusa]RXK83408.1 HAMP domain-containing histidine kinase [Filimonas effusa]